MQDHFKPIFDRLVDAAISPANPENPASVLDDAIQLYESVKESPDHAGAALATALVLAGRNSNNPACKIQVDSIIDEGRHYLDTHTNMTGGYETIVAINLSRALAGQASVLESINRTAALSLYQEIVGRMRLSYSPHFRQVVFPVPVAGAQQEFPPSFQTPVPGKAPLIDKIQGPYRYLAVYANTLAARLNDIGDEEGAQKYYQMANTAATEGIREFADIEPSPVMLNLYGIRTTALINLTPVTEETLRVALADQQKTLALTNRMEAAGGLAPVKASEWRMASHCLTADIQMRLGEDGGPDLAAALKEAEKLGALAGKVPDFLTIEPLYKKAFSDLFPDLIAAVEKGAAKGLDVSKPGAQPQQKP